MRGSGVRFPPSAPCLIPTKFLVLFPAPSGATGVPQFSTLDAKCVRNYGQFWEFHPRLSSASTLAVGGVYDRNQTFSQDRSLWSP